MSTPEVTYLGHPEHRTAADEGLHEPPPEASGELFGDTVWLSAIDPGAGIWGLNHMYIAPNRGYGRYQALYCIDGVEQIYLGKQVSGAVGSSLEYGQTSWTDGKMTYEVIEPFEQIRVTLDHTKFGFDFTYTARGPIFDYEDCVGGSPLDALGPVAKVDGGHYEQALNLTGTFEIRGGPNEGEVRQIDTIAHRDHTWSDRFSGNESWAQPEGQAALHFWLILHFPERNFNVTGFFDLSPIGIERSSDTRVGGFESSERGIRRVVDGGPAPLDGGLAEPEGDRCPLRWRIDLEGGETVHINMPEPHWVFKLLMLGEDDAESRLNDYETFGELVIEETGEKGFGEFEHSTLPPSPRFLT